MNGSRQFAWKLLSDIRVGRPAAPCDIAICPPFTYIDLCASALSGTNVRIGAQSVSEHEDGAHTGDISASMLIDAGCQYVLIGHSERRALHTESDDVIARKTRQAVACGLSPIVCVGESWAERRLDLTHTVLARQVRAVADALLSRGQLTQLTIAYEPVWAIGSGVTATPTIAQDAHAFIRACLNDYSPTAAQHVRILYGGSLKPENAAQLLAMPDIDGGLVGGASLDARQFLSIIEAAAMADRLNQDCQLALASNS